MQPQRKNQPPTDQLVASIVYKSVPLRLAWVAQQLLNRDSFPHKIKATAFQQVAFLHERRQIDFFVDKTVPDRQSHIFKKYLQVVGIHLLNTKILCIKEVK